MNKYVILMLVLLLAACAHVVSKETRENVDTEVSATSLFQDPVAYKGAIVILGGTIIKTENTEEGATIEVLQKELDYRGRPKSTDRSLGRFLAVRDDYLDPAIFRAGRSITVAGEVLGEEIRPLEEINYRYIKLKARELHLIKPGYRPSVHFGFGVFHSVN